MRTPARWHHGDITATLSPHYSIFSCVACYNAGMDTNPEATNDNDRPLYDAGQANDAIVMSAYTVPAPVH